LPIFGGLSGRLDFLVIPNSAPDRGRVGFLRIEPHEPEVWEAHGNIHPWYDKVDGLYYVKDTIDWLIEKASRAALQISRLSDFG
jgi:hypothetical protein